MSRYFDIEKALMDAVQDVAGNIPLSVPNRELAKYPEGLWLAMHNLRSQSEPVTLGEKGEDNHPGLIQIDVNVPQGSGTGTALQTADKFIDFFTAGKIISYNGQHVRISSSTLSPGRQVNGYYRISVSVYYYSRSQR